MKEENIKEPINMLLQLYQQGELASLAALIEGISAAVNNPLNPIYQHIQYTDSYIDGVEKLVNECEKLDLPPNHNISGILDEMSIGKKIAEIKEVSKHVKEGAEKIRKYVEELNFFANANTAGHQQIYIEDSIRCVLHLVYHFAKDKINFSTDFGDTRPIEFNVGRINQVFFKLLLNIADNISKRGIVSFETRMEDDRYVIVIISVSEAVDVSKYPVSKTYDKIRDTKLAMELAKLVLEQHHGTINLDNEKRKEYVYIIRLPVKQPKE